MKPMDRRVTLKDSYQEVRIFRQRAIAAGLIITALFGVPIAR